MGWIIILLGVLASLALSAHELLRDRRERYADFRTETNRRANAIRRDTLALAGALARINAFYAASDQVEPFEFDLFQSALEESDFVCSFCIAAGWVPDNAEDRAHAVIKLERQLTETIRFPAGVPAAFYQALQHPTNLYIPPALLFADPDRQWEARRAAGRFPDRTAHQ